MCTIPNRKRGYNWKCPREGSDHTFQGDITKDTASIHFLLIKTKAIATIGSYVSFPYPVTLIFGQGHLVIYSCNRIIRDQTFTNPPIPPFSSYTNTHVHVTFVVFSCCLCLFCSSLTEHTSVCLCSVWLFVFKAPCLCVCLPLCMSVSVHKGRLKSS